MLSRRIAKRYIAFTP